MAGGYDRSGGSGERQQPDYSYGANHNLVLQTDRSALPRRDNEPKGEPESLAGRVSMRDMGTRAQRDTTDLDQVKKDAKVAMEKREKKRLGKEQNTYGAEFSSILEASEDLEGLRYRPRTAETRHTYELILAFISGKLGDVPADVLRGATDQVLEILKSDMRDHDKKAEIAIILVTISQEEFTSLLNLSKKLTDYNPDTTNAVEQGTLDEQLGVAVIFEEEEEEDEDDDADRDEDENPYEIPDKDLGDHDEATTVLTSRTGAGGDGADDDEDAGEADGDDVDMDRVVLADHKSRKKVSLPAHEVDAFWLQRTISAHVDDVHVAQQKTASALEILAAAESAREAENALMELFEYSHFDLIKLLTANAPTIVYCTRLAKAANDDERDAILRDMRARGLDDLLVELGLQRASLAATQAMDVDQPERPTSTAPSTEGGPAPKALLDLEAMAFAQGGHTMTNKKVSLPQGSFKRSKKGYEEIHVPAPKPKPLGANEHLVPLSDLPEWAQLAFPNTKSLNRVQSQLYETAFQSSENMLVCAPTGAGKTNVAMLTVLSLLNDFRDPDSGVINKDAFKIVYIAPMKALVQEVVGNFGARLKPYNLQVAELTGDAQLNKQQLHDTTMIVTTPEKWDVITRKGTDRSYTALVRLVIIDEVHLLHDDRGPVIEAIVSRTLRHVEQTRDHIRLVGLSATLPNYQDVASFMRVKASGLKFFDSSYRPCPLQQQYIGITEKKALKRFQVMNQVTYDKVMEQAGDNQVLVFVHSRKDTAKTAKSLLDTAIEAGTVTKFIQRDVSREVLKTEAETVKDKDLKELLPYGLAIHHAGMTRADRTLVEELFADGHIQVLCSTATLAWGVNLPAHTVIIKGTQVYSPEKGKWIELSPQDVLQMLGRAGRPQFDTYGEGIIITTHTELQYYLSLLNTQLPIESQLMSRLADILNAEIVLGTITSRQEAVDWLQYSYLYVRMRRAPPLYGVDWEDAKVDPTLHQRRVDLVHSAVALLDKNLLVKYDRRTGKVVSTELGRIAAHYYISYPSMALYHQQLRPQSTLIDVFRVFSLSHEFKYIPVREEEKLELQKLNERIPIPIKESPDEPTAKVNILLQAHISQLKLEGFSLMADMVHVTQSAQRLFRALFEMALRRGWAQLAHVCLDACKMVERRQWSVMTPLRQFRNFPAEVIKRLERKELAFDRYFDLSPEELGQHVGLAKYGKTIHRYVHQLPKVEVAAQVLPVSRSLVKMDLTVTPDFQWDDKAHGAVQGFWIWVSDVDDEQLLYHEYFVLKSKFAAEDHHFSFTVPLFEPLAPNYFITVVSDSWLSSETRIAVSFRNLLLPTKFAPPTELLDLQPLPATALGKHADLFPVDFFNPIQTQVFHSVFMTDENALICAPPGSGKTYIAEWAVLRALYHKQRSADQRIVYMVPYDAMAELRFKQWTKKFAKVNVVLLTGQTTRDLQLVEQADIIITTTNHWDALSRRWRQRKNVYQTWLFIADELHLLTDPEVGVATEIVCSRMRFISAQRESDQQPPVRIVALAASMANAKDVGDWLGCATAHVYNFAPATRPHALQIHLQGLSIAHVPSQLLAMIKPAHAQLAQLQRDQQAILFVAGRAQCTTVAAELAAWMRPGESFLRVDPQGEQYQALVRVLDPALQSSLEHGIAWIHEAMTPRQRDAVLTLYATKAVQVLLATRGACWMLEHVQCHHVLILGTQTYNGQVHGYVDYPVADVLHMMGRATAKAHLITLNTKKEYYKRYLHEPMPVESPLDQHTLLNHFNAEIVAKTIENKQDAVDYLTWTLMYRRMTQNPNYYGLTGVTERHLSDFLSDLVEGAVTDLVKAKCITCEDEYDLLPLNLGMVAAYYSISTETIEMFALSLKAQTKLRGLLDVLSHAVEFSTLPIRHHEAGVLRKLYDSVCAFKLGDGSEVKFTDPHVKTHILLQCHFARVQLPVDLQADLHSILGKVLPLLYAAVDVLASHGWLGVALAAMELSQMCVQGVWDKDSPLKQIPHFSRDVLARFQKQGVESVFDVMELDEDVQASLFAQFSPAETAQIAQFVNAYPNLEVDYAVPDDEDEEKVAQVPIACHVTLRRDADESGGPADRVVAPLFPSEKTEHWWLVVGDAKSKQLYGIKRVTVAAELATRVDFVVPREGNHHLTLFVMSDSYLGCDQEYEFDVTVAANEDESSGDESGGEDGMDVDE
ncbi:DEIH-box ATPase [Allomyces arbusculus]|nr:DEIH-box ATPase [Allomyces arbusculus]